MSLSVASSGQFRDKPNPEQGLAALTAVELSKNDAALQLLKGLQGYVIFSPSTAVLRGVSTETQPRKPVGLSGGQLPMAIHRRFPRRGIR
jgi:hypothetical protein